MRTLVPAWTRHRRVCRPKNLPDERTVVSGLRLPRERPRFSPENPLRHTAHCHFEGAPHLTSGYPTTRRATEKSTIGMPVAGFDARHWPCPASSRPHVWCGLPRQATQ
jgi:hypothetical protein